jgi:hypothetical protein
MQPVVQHLPMLRLFPPREEIEWQGNQRVEQIMKLVLIPEIRPALFPHLIDGFGIEAARFFDHTCGQGARQRDSTRPAFFQASFVQKCVWIGVQQLMREL